jgi:hypothetical protein
MTSANNIVLDPTKCGIRSGEISILMATRGRPEMLSEEIMALKENTARKNKTTLWIYVDDDDQITRRAIDGKKIPDPGFPIHWHIGPRPPALGQAHQALWNDSGRVSEIYMITCDDARFDTPGWDEIVRKKFAEFSDGVLLAFAEDPNASDQATYPFIGWGFLQTLGYEKVFPGIFAFWFDDKWVEHIGIMAGRCGKIPMVINPIGGDKGKTQRMRCVPFWTRFFQLTLVERKACAEQLIAAMFPNDDAARKAALAEMEKAHATLKKNENDSFSDVYATFQEERHTALKPEERNLFNPLYVRQEVAAVVRLLSHAQKYIAEKNYTEALLFIEATQMADLRLRQAQEMKIQCLRALGRNAEADELAREKFLAWPEMNAVRRVFRFLGMVANEGRRLLASLSRKKNANKAQ